MFKLFAILFAMGAIIYSYVKKTINRYTGDMLSPAEIAMLKKELERDAIERPKSISAMTSMYLPRIGKDFPDFNYPEMKKRTETMLVSYLRAIDEEDPDKLKDAGRELKQTLKDYLGMLRDEGIHENYDLINIHRTEISRYMKDPGRCVITFQCALECIHNRERGDEITEGSRENKYQTKYEIDMVYVQDRDKVEADSDRALGYNCPNCGAPVRSLSYKTCEYCGCGIQEYNIKVWTFSAIREIGKKTVQPLAK